jgi:hypothetical protein
MTRTIIAKPQGHLFSIVMSMLIAHVAWHWMAERWEIAVKFFPPGYNF